MRDAIDGEEREGADGENGEEGRSVVRLVACDNLYLSQNAPFGAICGAECCVNIATVKSHHQIDN
ncbi:hypothetical protein WN943_007510 [Citrus x changshan-huyou]